jgi:hypothetical protein
VTQPFDRTCKIEPLGKIDSAGGEFWTNVFEMPAKGDNLSAYETNCVYLNVDGQRFLDVSFASAANLDSDSRSVMVGDFNRDRAPDLLVGSVGGGPLRLFLNRFPDANHRVDLNLQGTESNRPAIGSRIIVEAGGKTIVRDHFPANGFMGQSPAEMNVGVGTALDIDKLTVRWPNGKTQIFQNLPVDCEISIVEGSETYEVKGQDEQE